MTPASVKEGYVQARHLAVLAQVRTLLDVVVGDPTCHDVCRLVAGSLPGVFAHHRGQFNHYDHSWLVFRDDPDVIVDVYPWACASGPLLLVACAYSPWRSLYRGEAVP